MPRNARCVEASFLYHVTQRGVNKQEVFCSQGDRNCYLRLAADNAADAEVRILAWSLMTNHVHWIIQAGRKDSLAVFFRRVHGRYAQYFNARRGRTGHLWQNRFFSCPLGPTHQWRAIHYVESNPVRAGLVQHSEDYRWSSALAHTIGPEAELIPLLDWQYWRDAGGVDIWKQELDRIADIRQIRELHACTYSGRPFGDEEFTKNIEDTFQRRWLPIGRPKTKLKKREMGTEQIASGREMKKRGGSG